ncbi:MAG: hypothetical protein FWD84_01440 [Oscillospiraceae bacterium]|nr:hypothetical protein [Oscillospiraceae bacterium]
MKKFFVVVLVLLLVIAFAACGNGGEPPYEPEMPADIEEPCEPTEEPEPVEEGNSLLTASNEEIQQAVLDALNAADHSTFINVTGFSTWQAYISELLGVEPTVIFEVFNQGVRSGNRTTSITVQRLDRYGNDVPRGDAAEDTFTHWDFIHEINDEGVLRLFMRQHFDIEVDMSGVTRENFDAIEVGMSLDDVSALLGGEGTLGITSGNHEVRT